MLDLFEFYDGKQERCGFVLKSGQIIELPNIHPEPENGFEIDAADILRYSDDIAVIWHTHPDSASILSGEDLLCMEAWPQVAHMIIGNDGISTYQVEAGVVLNANFLPR